MYSFSVSKALQEFDLALRGKKKRAQFLKEGKKKVLSVWVFCNLLSFFFIFVFFNLHCIIFYMHDVPSLGNLLGTCLQLLICALIQLASCSLEVTKNKQYKKNN